MGTLITVAIILAMALSALGGWYFGTWQTRLRYKPNLDAKWNERCHYFRLWNPWHPRAFRHLLFTERDLDGPASRANRNPEDTRIPK
jgi:hypothetical protein